MSHKRNGEIITPKDEWGTPDPLFKQLDNEFYFSLDAAASEQNTKVTMFYSQKDDALLKEDWRAGSVYLNPPYSQGNIDRFMTKAHIEGYKRKVGEYIVCLVPVASDTKWWHNSVMHAKEIRFIKGRVKYIGYDILGNPIKNSPTFSSCVVIFSNPEEWHETPDGDFRPYIGKTIKQESSK